MWSPKKLTVLKWFDILILTIILFGDGIINSTLPIHSLTKSNYNSSRKFDIFNNG